MRNMNVFSLGINPPSRHGGTDESDWVRSVPTSRDALGKSQRSALAPRIMVWRPDETISSGIYLVRARTEDGGTASKMVMYLR
ncbi:hypothetical protein J7L68_07600 [bacterium]|nr:hypothetical protein [bacterium]